MDLPPVIGHLIKGILFVIEVVGLFIKHGVLAVRLLANMFAGHIVLLGIMMVAFSLFFQYPGLPDGSRYQWWDWGHLSIVGYGVMFLGIPLITSYLFIEGMRLVSGFRKRGKVSQTAS